MNIQELKMYDRIRGVIDGDRVRKNGDGYLLDTVDEDYWVKADADKTADFILRYIRKELREDIKMIVEDIFNER